MTTAFIAQPTYLGWCGYYAAIDQADVCVLLDTVEFSRQSWQQRNRVRLPTGAITWLTVPVHASQHQRLDTVRIAYDRPWRRKHLGTVQAAYGRLPGYETIHWVNDVYQQEWVFLADLNAAIIRWVCRRLTITTPIVRASELDSTRAGRIERLADILALMDADALLEPRSGTYLKHAPFHVEWFNYEPQPYSQGGLEWQSHLSVIDLLAHHGNDAITHIRSRS